LSEPEPEKLGEMLVHDRVITQKQLDTAMDYHASIGGHLGTLLVKLGYVTDDVLTHYVAQQQHIHEVDFNLDDIDLDLFKQIPRDIVEKHQVFPIKKNGDVITLAMADASDGDAVETIQFLMSCKVDPVLVPRNVIKRVIKHIYG